MFTSFHTGNSQSSLIKSGHNVCQTHLLPKHHHHHHHHQPTSMPTELPYAADAEDSLQYDELEVRSSLRAK